MCLIAKVEKKADLSRDVVSYAMKRNADGWGFMYALDGRVVSRVGMGGDNAFWNAMGSVPDDVPCAVHFRFATRGAKDKSNLHPFRVLSKERHGQDLWLMHNGPQITRGCKGSDAESDSREFVRTILTPMLQSRPRFCRTPTFRRIMEEMTKERVMLLEGCGKWHVFNRADWHTEDGVLYSNTYSLPRAEVAPYQGSYFRDGGYYDALWHEWTKGDPIKRVDGAGRIIPMGQTRPSKCPHRRLAMCLRGCKIGAACGDPPVTGLGKVEARPGSRVDKLDFDADREIAERIAGMRWSKTNLGAMSSGEVFQLVVEDPIGCQRFLREERVAFSPGVAVREPEKATDLVLDAVFSPYGEFG